MRATSSDSRPTASAGRQGAAPRLGTHGSYTTSPAPNSSAAQIRGGVVEEGGGGAAGPPWKGTVKSGTSEAPLALFPGPSLADSAPPFHFYPPPSFSAPTCRKRKMPFTGNFTANTNLSRFSEKSKMLPPPSFYPPSLVPLFTVRRYALPGRARTANHKLYSRTLILYYRGRCVGKRRGGGAEEYRAPLRSTRSPKKISEGGTKGTPPKCTCRTSYSSRIPPSDTPPPDLPSPNRWRYRTFCRSHSQSNNIEI